MNRVLHNMRVRKELAPQIWKNYTCWRKKWKILRRVIREGSTPTFKDRVI